MKRHSFFFFLIFALTAVLSVAQPSGRRPQGPPPGGFRPGQRPQGQFDPSRSGDPSRSQEVRQKKIKTSGSTFKVVGTLLDSVSREPMVYLNVAVLDSADSAFVKGASTDFDGYFEITEVPAGSYLLRVSYVGYQNRYIRFRVTNNTALGTLLLKRGAHTLTGVVVTAERPLYAMEGEKMIYNVNEDPSIQAGTTSDALQNAPGVEVDIEGNVTLRGVSSVEIWINDKPSKLTAENLKTYLETLPANALARIETITNPSAKYATESEAVINIITDAHIKKNQFVSFGVNGSSQPSVSPWISYMWANEKLSLNLYASGRYNNSQNTGFKGIRKRAVDSTLLLQGAADPYKLLEFDSTSSQSWSDRFSGNIFANLTYTIDTMTDLNVHGMCFYNTSNSWDYSSNLRDATYSDSDGLLNNYVDTTRSLDATSLFGMVGFDFTHKFDEEGHNLMAFASLNFNNSNGKTEFVRNYDGSPLYTNPLDQRKFYLTEGGGFSMDASLRYNRPYSKDGEMSYGAGYTYSHSDKDYTPTYLLSDGNSEVDSLRQYQFEDNENTVNADVNWTHRWGGFTLELGLGGEFYRQQFQYASEGQSLYPFLAADSTYDFFNLTPSIHLSYRTESMHNFKLNYSLRMQNPAEYNLSTYRRYTEDTYSQGNPTLTSSYTHSAEAGWTKFFSSFGNVGIEAYTRFSTNEINDLTDNEYDDILDRYIQYTMPYNVGMSYRYGASLNMTYRPSGFLNVRFYGNIYNAGYRFEYDKLGYLYDEQMLSYSFRVNCWTKIFNKYQVHASANYNSPTLSLMSTRKARYSLNCGVRADFFKRKLSAFINVQDIFNWGKTVGGGSTNDNPFLLSNTTSYTTNSRFISAGITFRFGKMELESRSKVAGEEVGTGE